MKNNIRYISPEQHKKIMLDILKFIDAICRRNDINYSLIGGSLIGAVRHGGYIPWDDDIDIILTKDNFDQLKLILEKENGRYQTMKVGNGGERFSFLKVIDTNTHLMEGGQLKYDPNYGIYLDIFCYYPTSNNQTEQKRHYRRLKLLRSLILRHRLDFRNRTLKQNIRWAFKNIISKIIGYNRINKMFDKELNRYSSKSYEYMFSNWPTYGYRKELQKRKMTDEYIDIKFESLTAMVFMHYDEILRTTFGDYMKLPPESKRVPKHNTKVWWRDGYGK